MNESVRLNTDRTVAVDSCYHWRLIATDPPPRAAKVQLVNRAFGVATYGTWYPGATWTHWAPLPTFAVAPAAAVQITHMEDCHGTVCGVPSGVAIPLKEADRG